MGRQVSAAALGRVRSPAWQAKTRPASSGEEAALFRPNVPVEVVRHAAEQVGNPTEIHRRYAAELVAAMPPQVVDAAHEPYGARAVIFASLLDRRRRASARCSSTRSSN